jgi:hypothetical protein
VDPLSVGEVGIKSRLRKGISPLLKLNEQSGRICCDKFRGEKDGGGETSSSGGLGEARGGYREVA